MSEYKTVNEIFNFIDCRGKSPDKRETGIPLLTAKNIKKGYISSDPREYMYEGQYDSWMDRGIPKEGDILFTTEAPMGNVAILPRFKKVVVAQRVICLSPNLPCDTSYYKWLLLGNDFQDELLKNATGSTVKGIRSKLLAKIKIPYPPLETQKKIAAILDAADLYRQKTKDLIAKYDELTQSLFLDMFGDPVRNEKGWEIDSLSNFGDLKNGLNFSKTEKGEKIGYLGVGDFKSLYKITDVGNLKDIDLAKLPSEDFILKNGDIVFVRSNGNKQLIGRCLAVYPEKSKVTFSGFCIRYRISNENLISDYLIHLFRIQSFKEVMLEGGRGANIQNINQKLLSDLKIPIPTIKLQNQFAERVQKIEVQKVQAQQSLEKAEELFNSLLQRAFKGELV